MGTAIDTSKVTGRRTLHFNSLDEILADVNQLEKWKNMRCLGNWSAGQILKHLTIVMNGALDGAPKMMPGFVVFLMHLLLKRRFLTKPMQAGFKLPTKAASLLPPPTSLEEGIKGFREAARRL